MVYIFRALLYTLTLVLHLSSIDVKFQLEFCVLHSEVVLSVKIVCLYNVDLLSVRDGNKFCMNFSGAFTLCSGKTA